MSTQYGLSLSLNIHVLQVYFWRYVKWEWFSWMNFNFREPHSDQVKIPCVFLEISLCFQLFPCVFLASKYNIYSTTLSRDITTNITLKTTIMNAMESVVKMLFHCWNTCQQLPNSTLASRSQKTVATSHATLKYLLILKLKNFPCFGVKFPVYKIMF